MKTLTRQTDTFARYLLVGSANTLICLSIMYLGASWGMDYIKYTAVGYLVTILFSFFMNLLYTFKVKGQLMKRFCLFFLVNFMNLLIVELIEYTLIESFSIKPVIAIFTGMGWYVSAGFLLNKAWVYKRKSAMALP